MTSLTLRRVVAMSTAAALVVLAGCSSSKKSPTASGGSTSAAATTATGPSTATGAPSASAPSPTTSAAAPAGSGGKLTVTGALVAALTEGTNPSAVQCHVDASGSGTNIIGFDGSSGGYDLQMGVPSGTTTFPDASGKSGIFFYDGDNSKLEWGASGVAQGGTGTVTRSADNKTGTLDVQMTDAAPPGSPKLAPIHVSGSWTC